jgi:hypothetical protein
VSSLRLDRIGAQRRHYNPIKGIGQFRFDHPPLFIGQPAASIPL